jgi:hypothetical protein
MRVKICGPDTLPGKNGQVRVRVKICGPEKFMLVMPEG